MTGGGGRPLAVLAATCLGWGTIPLVVRGVDLPGPATTLVRCWVAAAALGLVLRLRPGALGAAPSVPVRSVARLGLATGAVLAVHWSLQFAAYGRAPSPTVAFVIFLAPVGVALLAPLVLGEPTPPRTAAALALAVVGAGLVTGPSLRGASAAGVGLAAGSAAGLVALTLLAKRLAVALGGPRAALVQLAVAGVVLLPAAVQLGAPRAAWLRLVLLGLVHTALAVSLYLWALSRLPAATVGTVALLEPVGVTAVAALVGDLPSPPALAGGALVVAAGLLAATAPARAPAPTPPDALVPADG